MWGISTLSSCEGEFGVSKEAEGHHSEVNTYKHGSVVSHGISSFRSNVHDGPSGEQLPRLEVAKGYDKGVRATLNEAAVLSIGSVKLSHHNGVIGATTESTDPPLHRSEARRLENEGLGLGLVSGGGLKTLNVGSMSELSLRVTTYTKGRGVSALLAKAEARDSGQDAPMISKRLAGS